MVSFISLCMYSCLSSRQCFLTHSHFVSITIIFCLPPHLQYFFLVLSLHSRMYTFCIILKFLSNLLLHKWTSLATLSSTLSGNLNNCYMLHFPSHALKRRKRHQALHKQDAAWQRAGWRDPYYWYLPLHQPGVISTCWRMSKVLLVVCFLYSRHVRVRLYGRWFSCCTSLVWQWLVYYMFVNSLRPHKCTDVYQCVPSDL